MQCPRCGYENPEAAKECVQCEYVLDARLKGGFYAFHEDPEDTVANDKVISWVLFFIVVALVIFFWKDIKKWFWTADFVKTECVSEMMHDPADFPASEGWERTSASGFKKSQRNKICYQRTYKQTEVIDERFHPDEVKEQ